MIRAHVDLRLSDRMVSLPFLGEDGRPVAWLEIAGAAQIAIFGAPEDLRMLSAGAAAAAEDAEQMRRVAELLVDTGMGERLAA
jgi:hypothetical protein